MRRREITQKGRAIARFNEEQIKNNIILPLLLSMGFQSAELEFETSFKIQLGRGEYTVKKVAGNASGRLDVLCRRNGRPLFVIELKAESETLTETDRRQGLSYAQLLEPMAPYVLVTNGPNSELYSTVSGKRIDRVRWSSLSRLRPAINAEISLRFEALKQFVGLSNENLITFCRAQNKVGLAPFRASRNSPRNEQLQHKYIPQTYVRRKALESQFRVFLKQARHTVFPVIGDSGVGKTNTMCFLVDSVPNEPTLFYSGTLLSTDFLRQLSLDFNLVFSAQETPIGLLKKISDLGKIHGRTLTVFLDAVDEWELPHKGVELDLIVTVFSQLGMRLVLSCKTTNWDQFLLRKGVPSFTQRALFPNVPKLSAFSPTEFKQALEKYRKFLRLQVRKIAGSQSLSNPFGLRIACEVAFASQAPLEISIESSDNIREYLQQKLTKSPNPDACWRLVDSLAALLERVDQVQIEETLVRENLGMPILDELPKDVFEHGILYRYINESGLPFIGFYFSSIRDYILAIRVSRLREEDSARRLETLQSLLNSYVGESCVIYFFNAGTSEERKACLEAAFQSDRKRRTHHVARLLAWHGGSIIRRLSSGERKKLLLHLGMILFTDRSDPAVAEQVLDVIQQFDMDSTVESVLTDWLCRYAANPKQSVVMTSSRIAKLLQKTNTPTQTKRLVTCAMDSSKDGYVRRYAIDALEERTVPRRKSLFFRLIQDRDPDVRMWIRGWYNDLEDPSVRDAMLDILQKNESPDIQEDVLMSLAGSRLEDTGKRLYAWLVGLTEPDEFMAGWACRALAELNYRPVIPDLVRRLKDCRGTDLGEQLVISLGELRAKEALPDLLKLAESIRQEPLLPYWCALAISQIAGKKIQKVLGGIQTTKGHRLYVCLLALAMTGTRDAENSIVSFLLDKTNPLFRRSELLSIWGSSVLGSPRLKKAHDKAPKKLPFSKGFRRSLYNLLGEHNNLSPRALSFLIELEEDLDSLHEAIAKNLPRFQQAFVGREVPGFHSSHLEELGHRIRDWLNQKLGSSKTPPVLLRSCLALGELMGDGSTWEAIQTNRPRIEAAVKHHSVTELERRLRGSLPPRLYVEGTYE
jgi:hypothetical protein